MDLLEEYRKQYILSEESILSAVDEWCLYLYYLENNDLQLNTTYRSPVRDKDDSPSFSIYENTRSKKYTTQYLWKDSALNLVGNIFELLSRMYSIGINDVYHLINKDFDILEESKDISIQKRVLEKPTSKNCRIRYKSIPFSKEVLLFWNQIGVDEKLLAWKQVKQIEYLWFSDEQIHPIKVKSLTFVYPEWSKEENRWFTQVYSPFEDKRNKFRNDIYLEDLVYGWNHLEYKSPIHIITKSNKDILVLKSLGFESTSPKSETTPYPKKRIEELRLKYSRVVSLYDNDLPGIENSKKLEIENLFIPIESNCKDISDYTKMYGLDKAKSLLLSLGLN